MSAAPEVIQCYCGAEIKRFEFQGVEGWVHVESVDDRCYPDEDSDCKATPYDEADPS